MENNIKQFGIYIKNKDNYSAFTSISNTSFPEFKHLSKVQSIQRENDALELVIYIQNFNASYFAAQARKLSLAGSNEEISFDIEPLAKENMFKLTTSVLVPDGSFLFISAGWNEILAVFLGHREKEAIAFFSDMDMRPAYAAVPDLEDTIKVFPNSQELLDLLPKWKKIQQLEKEDLDYKYVAEAWKKYTETEKISLKVRYLKDLQMALNGFLANHPNNNRSQECEERQAEIKTKLPEFEKIV